MERAQRSRRKARQRAQQRRYVFRRLSRPTLATKTATATSILFLAAILVVGIASMHSFRTQLMNVLIAEQNTLVERIADNVDQRLLWRGS